MADSLGSFIVLEDGDALTSYGVCIIDVENSPGLLN